MDLLKAENLNRSFGGLKAVDNISFSVGECLIKAVIGPNGAGKTTLFNLISGFLRPDSGSIVFADREIAGKSPFQVAEMGMARTFQHIKLFPKMTALENVMTGRHIHSRAGFIPSMLHLPGMSREEKFIRERSLEIMESVGIMDLADIEATDLAYGQQRAVELARALACEPRLLLLDEPAAGLNMRETAEVAGLIKKIRDSGITILIVEHDMSLVMGISDEIIVLSYGEKIAEDVPLAIQKNREVVRVYLGEDDA
ncbi:lipopolysaccharide export system ATP-binding protein LptB [bacterium BMS3Abin07]|nr:lipopolysaccharide export system ATP-binding protein LptB [bacterium BMS3Abin07]GBE31427.1 lipopolysaccharide export system ATP-binding protein LptB [bacterium BMS3Bbin05]HDL21256.1 ABC transporter ATP-binding protein [Nitrospirota bacterium]HDO22180.1 ABC transporter ATP-binding protein [Nitrospirota bacterium]